MSESSAYPLFVFAVSLAAQWLAAFLGTLLRRWKRPPGHDIDIIQAATMTLLALIIGFSFSMAVTRYDQRQNYEEAEANAISTAFLRADLLPGDDAAHLRDLLKKYLDLRIAFYEANDAGQIAKITADTTSTQNELWQAILPAANAHPTQITALAVTGINDVLDAQGSTQGAWLNRFTRWRLGHHGTDRARRQRADRHQRAHQGRGSPSDPTGDLIDLVSTHRRYR